jgi:hypothetical protein
VRETNPSKKSGMEKIIEKQIWSIYITIKIFLDDITIKI